MEEYDYFWKSLKIINAKHQIGDSHKPTPIENLILTMNEYFIFTEPYVGIFCYDTHDISYHKTYKDDRDIAWNFSLILLDIFRAGSENLPMYKGFHITKEKEELIISSCQQLIKYGLEPNLPAKVLIGSNSQNDEEILIPAKSQNELETRRKRVFIVVRAVVTMFFTLDKRHIKKEPYLDDMLKTRLVSWRRQLHGLLDNSLRYRDTKENSKESVELTDQLTHANAFGFFINSDGEVLGVIPTLIEHFTPDVAFTEISVSRYGDKRLKRNEDCNYLNDILNIISNELFSTVFVSIIILLKESEDKHNNNNNEQLKERIQWAKDNFSKFTNMRKANCAFSDIVDLSCMEGKPNTPLKNTLQKVISKIIFLSKVNFQSAIQCLMDSNNLSTQSAFMKQKKVAKKLEVILRRYIRKDNADKLIERLYDGLTSDLPWVKECCANLVNYIMTKKDKLANIVHSEILRLNITSIASIRTKRESVAIVHPLNILYTIFNCRELYSGEAVFPLFKSISDILFHLYCFSTQPYYMEKYLRLLTIFFENLPEDIAADYFDNLIGLKYISQDHEYFARNISSMKVVELNYNEPSNYLIDSNSLSLYVIYNPEQCTNLRFISTKDEVDTYAKTIMLILKQVNQPLKYDRFYLFRILLEMCKVMSIKANGVKDVITQNYSLLTVANHLMDTENNFKKLKILCKQNSLYILDCIKELFVALLSGIENLLQENQKIFLSVITAIIHMLLAVFETKYQISENACDRNNKMASFVPLVRKLLTYANTESKLIIRSLLFCLMSIDITDPQKTTTVGMVNVVFKEANKYTEPIIDLTGKDLRKVYNKCVSDMSNKSISRQLNGVRHLSVIIRSNSKIVESNARKLCDTLFKMYESQDRVSLKLHIIEAIELLTCFEPKYCMDAVMNNLSLYMEMSEIEDSKPIEMWMQYLLKMAQLKVFEDQRHMFINRILRLSSLEFTLKTDKISLLVEIFTNLKKFGNLVSWKFETGVKKKLLSKCFLYMHYETRLSVKKCVLLFFISLITNDTDDEFYKMGVIEEMIDMYKRLLVAKMDAKVEGEILEYIDFVLDRINADILRLRWTQDIIRVSSDINLKYLDMFSKIVVNIEV